MSLLTCASGASRWRGYNYFLKRRATITKRLSSHQYEGMVAGSDNAIYHTFINVEHPRQSTCDCPHADGKRIICKHMIALFFTAYPLEATKYNDEMTAAEEAYEQEQEKLADKVFARIAKMKKGELQQALLYLLQTGPEWQWDRFIREYIE